jgi:hypothetical protein
MPQLDEPAMPGAYAADVPLICDPVPGPDGFASWGQHVVVANRVLTEREVESLREQWRRVTSGAGTMIFMPEDVSFVSVFEPRQWPDAEFCAA